MDKAVKDKQLQSEEEMKELLNTAYIIAQTESANAKFCQLIKLMNEIQCLSFKKLNTEASSYGSYSTLIKTRFSRNAPSYYKDRYWQSCAKMSCFFFNTGWLHTKWLIPLKDRQEQDQNKVGREDGDKREDERDKNETINPR